MSAVGGDWRNGTAYDYVDTLAPEQIPFEFLRRNPDYRADYPRLAIAPAELGPPLALTRWGLRFRGRPEQPRRSDLHRVAAACEPAPRSPGTPVAPALRRS